MVDSRKLKIGQTVRYGLWHLGQVIDIQKDEFTIRWSNFNYIYLHNLYPNWVLVDFSQKRTHMPEWF